MYADNTLTPKEAARLCALGTLALHASMPYAALAESVRHFLDRVQGPSLDVLGSSLELLKYEGLVDESTATGETVLAITSEGQRELMVLLTAPLRPGATDLNKLIVALKFRFMHLLDPQEQRQQIELMLDTTETELARLSDLRQHHAGDTGHLVSWLDHEIGDLERRIAWLSDFGNKAG